MVGKRGGIRGEFRNCRQQTGLARGGLFGKLSVFANRGLAAGRHGLGARRTAARSAGTCATATAGDPPGWTLGLGELQGAPKYLPVLENSQTAFIDYSGLLAII